MKNIFLRSIFFLFFCGNVYASSWELGPFTRVDANRPILKSDPFSSFFCPMLQKNVFWESGHVFNPGAALYRNQVVVIYRAEDNCGSGLGNHTSRLGFAISEDGVHFTKNRAPTFFPQEDAEADYEHLGGCEDPRIVQREDGLYVMTYTQWNRQIAVLAVASSNNLKDWKKHGYAFSQSMRKKWSKAGAIVCRATKDGLIAAKIHGKYWMYWGEGTVYAATSEDLIHWTPIFDQDRRLLPILEPRASHFDSLLVEPGPPAILQKDGILLLYNGKNSGIRGDKRMPKWVYSPGQVLFNKQKPTQVLQRASDCFLTPETSYERSGQYGAGAIFVQGLVPYQGSWYLYYGAADSGIGVATCPIDEME